MGAYIMSYRIKKEDVQGMFERFCKVTNNKIAKDHLDIGGLHLDYNSIYGGYVIHRVANSGGGVDCPYGMSRKQKTEFYYTLHFAILTVGDYKECMDKSQH